MAENKTQAYDRDFFAGIKDGSCSSANEIVPRLITLVHPASVVDVGCGTGAWLSVFREQGVQDVLGIDGDYVDRKQLLIPTTSFQAANVGQPLKIDRRFDLVLSLEVGEHLAPECARTYVDNLVALGDVIAFSAAIPCQGGNHHVNEQWPEYWKVLFEARGYVMIDCLRSRFWNNGKVEYWYRQNLFLVVKEERLRASPALLQEIEHSGKNILSLVHPLTLLHLSPSQLLHLLPDALRRAFKRRFQKETPAAPSRLP